MSKMLIKLEMKEDSDKMETEVFGTAADITYGIAHMLRQLREQGFPEVKLLAAITYGILDTKDTPKMFEKLNGDFFKNYTPPPSK